MKKILTVLFAVMIIVASAASVLAEGDNHSTEVTYTVGESYTLSVPSDPVSANGGSIEVKITGASIAVNKQIEVTVDSANAFKLVNTKDADDKLAYKIESGTPAVAWTDEGVILTAPYGTSSVSVTGTCSVTGTATKADTFKDTLTFSASIVDAAGAYEDKGTYSTMGVTAGNVLALPLNNVSSIEYTKADETALSTVTEANFKAQMAKTGCITVPADAAFIKANWKSSTGTKYITKLTKNLYTTETLYDKYYDMNFEWSDNLTSPTLKSVKVEVTAGQKVISNSFASKAVNNCETDSDGIRLTFYKMVGDTPTKVESYGPADTYSKFSSDGYVTVPANATWVNLCWWTTDTANLAYIFD